MSKNAPQQKRADALDQLKTAQKMLREGRAELARAHEKIESAQKLIDKSADTLRETWSGKRK